MKKAVIFDLNGVMIVGPMLSERFRDEKGVPPEKFLPALKEVMSNVRMPGARPLFSYWEPYLKEWGIAMTEQEFHDFWFRVEREHTAMVVLARELKAKGLRLFILSNNLRERSAYYDKHFPFIKELFEKEYYSWKSGFVKPDPRAYELVLRENNLTPDEVVYFDDREENITAAQALGIESYLYRTPEQVKEKLQ